MTFPSEHQLAAWATTLARTDWHDLCRRLQQAIQRDQRGGNAIPDGYPTSTRGGSGGTAELTSVEAAVEARIRGARDEHHQLTRNACWRFEDILTALATCVTMLDRMDTRAVPEGTDVNDWCRNCLRNGIAVVRYRGDLCRQCYDFNLVERFLPPLEIVVKWANGERVYERDIAELRRKRRAG